ncbi:hypothetical protein C0Q70_21013 [Pomacea canaliculata]|uniref:Uncharacterized protein n=1 Tax=Pomacea canaliculata TaxID=400727 RepID=A0A2T7NBB5_POMCA|nr:uncharacterized protein LOC112555390 [Pomacea canaliculata]PVD18464.1 hypothetical protein C0Q70_21013 [Pomacea canaliculata]
MSVNGSSPGEYVPSPRPHPRLRPEGAAYAERNRGNMERWFDYSDNVNNYTSPRPGERLRTDTARKIAEVNKGCMDEMMGGYADPPIQRQIHPRGIKPEATAIAEANKGDGMRVVLEDYANLDIHEPTGPKVHGAEAKEYADRNHGQVDHIINNYGVVTPTAPPPPKVGLGGQDNLEKAQGAGMGPILRMEGNKTPHEPKIGRLHQESQDGGWDEVLPASRTRPEAENIAIKNSNDSMYGLLRNDNVQPVSPAKDLKTLPHMKESPSPRKLTTPPRMRPEGMKNYERAHNQSEMSAILRGEGDNRTATPQRNLRHLQRSELW